MSQLSEQEIKDAHRRRIDESNREKAVKQTAMEQAIESGAMVEFLRLHAPNERGRQRGVFFDCQANLGLLIPLAREIGNGVADIYGLEQAFIVLTNEGRLAPQPVEEYVRATDTKQSRGPIAQIKHPTPPDLKLPYTRSEVLSWSTERLRAEMAKSPAHVKSLNAILAERQ